MSQKEQASNQYSLPEGWKCMKLGEVCDVIMGQSPPGNTYTDSPEGLPFFQGKADFSDYFPEVRIWCSQPIKIAVEGDILISVRAPVGPVNINNLKCCIGRGLAAIRCKEVAINWYIFWYLKSIEAMIASLGSGSTFRAIKRNDLENLKIPLPRLEEQRRIAAKIKELIQEVDWARFACEKQLEAAKALPSAYLREVFESAEAKRWDWKRMEEACKCDSGVWGEEPDDSPDCYPVLRSNNIKEWKMVFEEIAIRKIANKDVTKKQLRVGDILVTTSSGSRNLLGKSAIFTPPDDKVYLFSNFTMRLTTKPYVLNSFYLHFYLQSPEAKKVLQLIQDTTTGLRNIDRKEFMRQLIPLPPIETQYLIVSYLKEKMAEVERLHTNIDNQLEVINALLQAILRKAFKGQL